MLNLHIQITAKKNDKNPNPAPYPPPPPPPFFLQFVIIIRPVKLQNLWSFESSSNSATNLQQITSSKNPKKPIAFRGKIAKLSFLRKTRLKLSCSSSNKEESRGDQGEKAQIMNSVVPASWMWDFYERVYPSTKPELSSTFRRTLQTTIATSNDQIMYFKVPPSWMCEASEHEYISSIHEATS